MKSLVYALSSIALLFFAACASSNASTPAEIVAPAATAVESPVVSVEKATVVAAEVLFRGTDAKVEEASIAFARSEAEFAAIWNKAVRSGSKPPAVDFSTSMVVAAFMGRRNKGGYGYDFISAKLDANDRVVVTLRATAPEPGISVTMAVTSPVLIVSVPRKTTDPLVVIEEKLFK